MTDKPTDAEIVKALECCAKARDYTECEKLQCPLYRECKIEHKAVEDTVIPYALDLINRLQAENERLREDSKRLKKVQMQLDDMMIMHHIIKAEAYKECAEKIKQKTLAMIYSPDEISTEDYIKCIDDVVKELEGETDG